MTRLLIVVLAALAIFATGFEGSTNGVARASASEVSATSSVVDMYVKVDGARLRSRPSTESMVKATLRLGTKVRAETQTVTGADGRRWYKVTYNSLGGYMREDLLSRTKPGSDPGTGGRNLTIPVLMYHSIGSGGSRYNVSFESFKQQLDWLRANGYTTVTLPSVYNYIYSGGSLPRKPVVLTFDDGYANHWNAVQAMNARGMKGVFYVPVYSGLSTEKLKSMAANGHQIASHTFNHPNLTTLSDSQLRHEIAGSKQALESRLGIPIRHFAYPYGAYNDRVIAAVKAAGYQGAVAAWGGSRWTPAKRWVQPRVEVSGLLSLNGFANLVRSHTG